MEPKEAGSGKAVEGCTFCDIVEGTQECFKVSLWSG